MSEGAPDSVDELDLGHISYSAWQLARNYCQHRWKLDFVEKKRYDQKITGINLDFGTAIHGTVECFYSKNPVPGMTEEISVFLFEQYFSYLYTKNLNSYSEKDKKVDFNKLLESGRRIISDMYKNQLLQSYSVMFNEYRLKEKIERTDNVKIYFKGYVDLIIRTKNSKGKSIIYICDFKTCGWGWTMDQKKDYEKQFQILLYKYFFCKKHQLDPKDVRCAFILLKKAPRKNDTAVEFFPISAGPISVQRAVDRLNADITELADRIKNNSILKNRTNCHDKWGDVCPYLNTENCTNEDGGFVPIEAVAKKKEKKPVSPWRKSSSSAIIRSFLPVSVPKQSD